MPPRKPPEQSGKDSNESGEGDNDVAKQATQYTCLPEPDRLSIRPNEVDMRLAIRSLKKGIVKRLAKSLHTKGFLPGEAICVQSNGEVKEPRVDAGLRLIDGRHRYAAVLLESQWCDKDPAYAKKSRMFADHAKNPVCLIPSCAYPADCPAKLMRLLAEGAHEPHPARHECYVEMLRRSFLNHTF
jgi:hypothetical protein